MPVLLTATGIGWMIFGPNQTRTAVRYNRYAYDDAEEGAEGLTAKISETMQSGATATRQQFAKTTETAKETVNTTTNKVKETADRAADALHDVKGMSSVHITDLIPFEVHFIARARH